MKDSSCQGRFETNNSTIIIFYLFVIIVYLLTDNFKLTHYQSESTCFFIAVDLSIFTFL